MVTGLRFVTASATLDIWFVSIKALFF